MVAFAVDPDAAANKTPSFNESIFNRVREAAGRTYNTPLTSNAAGIITPTITKFLNLVVGLLGVVATLLIIYSGYLWMTAGGDDGQIDKAKTIIKQVVVGFIVLSLAYAIVTFVFSLIGTAGGGDQQPSTQGEEAGAGGQG